MKVLQALFVFLFVTALLLDGFPLQLNFFAKAFNIKTDSDLLIKAVYLLAILQTVCAVFLFGKDSLQSRWQTVLKSILIWMVFSSASLIRIRMTPSTTPFATSLLILGGNALLLGFLCSSLIESRTASKS